LALLVVLSLQMEAPRIQIYFGLNQATAFDIGPSGLRSSLRQNVSVAAAKALHQLGGCRDKNRTVAQDL
jgi:hypothetical protein